MAATAATDIAAVAAAAAIELQRRSKAVVLRRSRATLQIQPWIAISPVTSF
jgi:hypothetical protein